MRAPLSPAQLEAAAGAEAEWIDMLPAHAHQLSQLFAGHDAFDVMAGVLLAQAMHHDRVPAIRSAFLDGTIGGELTAMILVERASRSASESTSASLPQTVAAAIPHLEALTAHTPAAISRYWRRVGTDPFARMHERFLRRYLYVPFNETDEQVLDLTRDLFDEHVDAWLTECVGFSSGEAHLLVTASHDGSIAKHSAEPLGMTSGVGTQLSFTARELADRAGLAEETARRFCEHFSQPFGQQAATWPALPTKIRHRPLLRDGDGSYLFASPAMLRRSVRHSLAATLNPALPSGGRGHRGLYQRHLDLRARALERRSLKLLGSLLRPDHQFDNLHFAFRDGSGLVGEIDGLIIVDRCFVVVQAKSAPTRIDALASEPAQFSSVLDGIVREAMRQHDDARAALAAPRSNVRFWRHVGSRPTPVSIPDMDGAEVLPITVTLDDLSGCAAASWELTDVGLATTGRLPWIVAITPLETMIDLLQYAAQFVQFLRRRQLLNASRNLDVADEIDIFLEFLDNHLDVVFLRPSVADLEGALLMPPERFHDLDRWLMAKRSEDTRVRPPRQKLHGGVRRLLDSLDRDRPSGWLETSVAVLDAPPSARRSIGAMVNSVLAHNAEGHSRGVTFSTQEDRVTAFVAIRDSANAKINDVATLAATQAGAERDGASHLFVIVLPRRTERPTRLLAWGKLRAL